MSIISTYFHTINDFIMSDEFIYNKKFILFGDIIRVCLLVATSYLIFMMATNIDEVKLLHSDPCLICMVKTNSTCYENTGLLNRNVVYKTDEINVSKFVDDYIQQNNLSKPA